MNQATPVEVSELWMETKNEDKFLKALRALCFDYTETDEEYSFKYEVEDKNVLYFSDFTIQTFEPEEFIDALAALCSEHAVDDEFGFEA